MSEAARKRIRGYTLLETVIALAIWAVLAAGASRVLVYTARTVTRIVERQNAFENARAAMDALTVNIQMADTVLLETDTEGVLKKLTLTERAPNGSPANYTFYFSKAAKPGEAKYHRLEFGLNDEFASRIETIILNHTGNRITITVTTDDVTDPPFTLIGSADTRYKKVTVKKN